MNSLIVIVFSLVAVCVSARTVGPKIVGGVDAKDGQSPWQISLNADGWFGSSHICGGSLIDTKAVATAAHCCDGYTASQLSVKYGGIDRTKLATTNKVAQVFKHEKYNSGTIDWDYCVLILQDEVQLSTNVKLIEIATAPPPTGTKADLTGWGKISSSNNNLPAVLQYSPMDILSQKECNDIWNVHNTVTPNMICATNKAASGCNGDSGGPLVANGKLVGIVSWVYVNCPVDTTVWPTVYADPTEPEANAWIKDKVAKGRLLRF